MIFVHARTLFVNVFQVKKMYNPLMSMVKKFELKVNLNHPFVAKFDPKSLVMSKLGGLIGLDTMTSTVWCSQKMKVSYGNQQPNQFFNIQMKKGNFSCILLEKLAFIAAGGVSKDLSLQLYFKRGAFEGHMG